MIIGALILLWAGWHLTAKHWFTGPKRTVDLPEGVTVNRMRKAMDAVAEEQNLDIEVKSLIKG